MLATRLILVEGLPGTGKSTAAQAISRNLAEAGVPNKWWYEEEWGHPVYVYDNEASMKETIDDLANGRYRRVIGKALARWRAFADSVRASREGNVIVADGCLFGYLTWSLFPQLVPREEIAEYVAEVLRILAPCQPCVICLDPVDIRRSMRRICDRRGKSAEERFIRHAEQCAYGRKRRLAGFDGLVAYWSDYDALLGELFADIRFPKLRVPAGAESGDSMRQILDFVGIAETERPIISREKLADLTGSYSNSEITCIVHLKGGRLLVDCGSMLWPDTPLIALSTSAFEMESLPVRIEFGRNALVMSGPDLYEGKVNQILRRNDPSPAEEM